LKTHTYQRILKYLTDFGMDFIQGIVYNVGTNQLITADLCSAEKEKGRSM
jgi:hypothetical protein